MLLPSSVALWFGLLLFSFNHKVHAPLKLQCTGCHISAATGERAGFPDGAVCLACHPRLPAGKSDKIEPARSVYQLAEFVHFSHARHSAAKLVCRTCHGNVSEMEEVKQVLPMTMKACITCHRATHAPTKCGKCHELAGQ